MILPRQPGLVVLCFLLVGIWTQSSFAGSDPALRWHTLPSEHFRVHYSQGGEDMAKQVLLLLEEARIACGQLFGLYPRQPIEAVIADNTDQANGFARVYPYNLIWIYAVPPYIDSDLSSFSDPLRSLVFHEYAHIIHMDEVSGLPAGINTVLGKTILPNGASHIWFLEGIATFAETHLTSQGRLQASMYDMYLRTDALYDRLVQLSGLTTGPARFLRGTAPYLYGGMFVQWLADIYGTQALTSFIVGYGKRVIPFSMNTLARRHFGEDFLSLYRRFLADVQTRAKTVQSLIEEAKTVEGKAITKGGEYHRHPVFSPDGRYIYFVKEDGRRTPGIYQMDTRSRRQTYITDCRGGCGPLSLSPDGKTLYTTHLERHRIYSLYSDAYQIDLDTHKKTRLTKGARAQDVCSTPQGGIVYVTTAHGQSQILKKNPDGQTHILVEAGIYRGIHRPLVLPDGSLVFAAAQDKHWEIYQKHPGAKEVPLTKDGGTKRNLYLSQDQNTLCYANDHTGISNIYCLDIAGGSLRQLTNVWTGAFWPAIHPEKKSLVYARYGPEGYDFYQIHDPFSQPVATVPIFRDRCWPQESPDSEGPFVAPEDISIPSPVPYSALSSLRPHSIRPRYAFSSTDMNLLGLELFGSDAVGHHSWKLFAESSLHRFSPTAGFRYSFHRWFPTLSLTMQSYETTLFLPEEENIRLSQGRSWYISGSAQLPIPGRLRSFFVSLGYSIRWITHLHPLSNALPVYYSGPVNTRKASFYVSLVHDSRESRAWSISYERGTYAALSINASHPYWGSAGTSLTTSLSLRQYIPLPWFSNHVLALMFSGAFSQGDLAFQDAFTVGGISQRYSVQDLLSPKAITTQYLRGFSPGIQRGNQYALVHAEYRFPLWYIHRGLQTHPIALRRLWATAFVDAGGAWMNQLRQNTLLSNIGAELCLSTELFLALTPTLRLGYAHGFGQKGQDTVYFTLSSGGF